MTQEGRSILFRVEIRCAERWGLALWEMETTYEKPPFQLQSAITNETDRAFGCLVWHEAIRIVHALRNGGKA